MSSPSPGGDGRVTLRDLAREAGVSHSTISRALRGDPQISRNTTARIQELARSRNFRPDPALSALVTYRQKKAPGKFRAVLAWLNAWDPPEKLRRYRQFDSYWEGASEAAEARGYELEEFVLSPRLSPARLQKILTSRNIRGLLIPPHPRELPFEGFDFDAFAAVRFGRSLQHPPVSLVNESQTVDTMTALRQMTARGYHRIGYVSSPHLAEVTTFDAGYLKFQSNLNVRPSFPILTLEANAQATAAVREKIRAWMRRVRPDAILTTEGNLKALLKAAGYRVPADVALAAVNLGDCDANAGIFQAAREIGRVAVLTLVGLLQNHQLGIPEYYQDILIRGKWVDGPDLPPARSLPPRSPLDAVP